jgi:hypothetical protein
MQNTQNTAKDTALTQIAANTVAHLHAQDFCTFSSFAAMLQGVLDFEKQQTNTAYLDDAIFAQLMQAQQFLVNAVQCYKNAAQLAGE